MAKVRTTCPSTDNKYYLKSPTGYNKCILGNKDNKHNPRPTAKSCLPNCVGYAYGRYLEYWGLKSANLPTCNAKNWDDEAKKNKSVKYSKTPEEGAIIVFEGTTYGHVAFVEEIKANGDLFLSESNWSGVIFRNVTVKKSECYNYSAKLKCVGFVCNPNAPKVEKPKTEDKPKEDAPKPGNYKVNTALLNVRTGAGLNYRVKTFNELTSDAQKKIRILNHGRATNGYVDGLTFTASEVVYNKTDKLYWGKTPSGWVALKFCKKV